MTKKIIEQDLERDLELNSKEGSKLTRMIHAFRELAQEDQKVAAVLHSFQLLVFSIETIATTKSTTAKLKSR